MSAQTLRITEIFYSLQGETSTVGLPTAFVRLTGCPLRCTYCDTEYAFHGGKSYTLNDILDKVASYAPRHVTVTGGEPLAQPDCRALLSQLCDAGYQVSLETSGALSIENIDPRVTVVMDLKTPASGEAGKNLWPNINALRNGDEIKFVICDRRDYEWTRLQIDQLKLNERDIEILLSPSQGQLAARTLADWILEDNLPVRLQVQLHKQLWGDIPGK